MKKICLISAVALLCLVSCTSGRETELKASNLQYEVWSSEKIFALLPDQAKAAVCDFNDDYRNIDSVSAVFTECSTTTHIYKSKSGTVLKDDSMECQTLGSSDDLTYYDKKGHPVLRFIERYLPATNMTTQTFLFFEDGQYKNAFMRAVEGNVPELIDNINFTVYEPMTGERMVDDYAGN